MSHRCLSLPRSVRATVYGFIITELITNKTLSFAFQGLGLKLQEISVSLISLCRIYYRFATFCTISKKERIRISQERNMTSIILLIFLLSDVARNNRATFFFEICKREAVHQRSQVPVRELPAECLTLPVVCNFLLRYFPLYAPDLEGMPRIPVSFFVSFFELLNYVAIIESARPNK